MNDNKPQVSTLDDIRLLRSQALLDVQQQKEVLATTTRKLMAPLTPTMNKGNAIKRAFNTGMAIFDGFMLGIRLIRKFRKIVRR